ncbi:MAG: anthranilate synthase component I [Phycisphaerae bacterium]|mgnify:CR=1 FL=1|nr:anthranilate synthase component I [Phycisphaerae bacterium]
MAALTVYPEYGEFSRLAQGGVNVVPVFAQVLSDNLTPVSAYARLAAQSSHSFLLESVVGGEKIARYSFLSVDPILVFDARGREVQISEGDRARRLETADPVAELENLLRPYRAVHLPELPRFLGGVVGYAGYDMIRYYERLPQTPHDDRGLPDLLFGLYPDMVVFDHVTKTIKVVSNAMIADDPKRAYIQACGRIERILDRLAAPLPLPLQPVNLDSDPSPRFTSNFKRGDFEAAVDRCKEYIKAGDIFQVVLSQRLTVDTEADPFSIYRALRVINPSPFMFHLKSPQCTLVGASPEIMCRVEDRIVTNRPLAGTRRRGRTEDEDKALETELLADPKERAEHIMLVDLGRNDVGKVCELGSVKLDDVMAVERYSHVMHISSNVQGTLAPDRTAFDALRATLPVGTVSGAPKVRAMEIIDEFEPTKRGPYAGAVGYVDFSGNMDTCIALRTLVLQGRKAYVQVGAGLVADSVPENEYQETINKAKGQLKAIETAEKYLKG